MNSLRSVERAVRFEIERQAAVLDAGRRIVQETRHFHEDNGHDDGRAGARKRRRITATSPSPTSSRSRLLRTGSTGNPRRPARAARRPPGRLQAEWTLSDLDMTQLTNAGALDLVSETVAAGATATDARKWWMGEPARHANESGVELSDLEITPAQVARVSELVRAGKLNDKLARQVLDAVLAGEGDPDAVIEAQGLAIVSDDSALLDAVDAAIAASPDIAAKIRAGKTAAAAALLGQVMTATKGRADANRVRELILERLT